MNSNSPAADRSSATLQQGLQDISDGLKSGQDQLSGVYHGTFSESSGHVPTGAPKATQAMWSESTGHRPTRK